ncbi:MAG TPA: SDR family NAD(P)-dependent oxidoreductase [Patescibacteria group bacterium]|nr:SDR family NAD(P)-dependent oxidoreductase [Patescibacteria group bacterium]
MLEQKTILVTGGAGFIGSHLCEELLAQGGNVICFDNFSQSSLDNVNFLSDNPSFTLIKGDCNKRADIEKVFQENKIDYVFHYAAVVGVKRTQENPLSVLEDIEGIKHIFRLSHEYKVKKVVFASSSEVYGEPIELPEKEDGVLNAHIPYAHVKLIGEDYVKAYWEKYHLPTVSLRFFNVYGPRQESSDYGFVVGIFMRQVLEGKSPTVVGDGQMTRNFVYVKDNVQAAITCLPTDQVNGEVLNIGTGDATTILELAQKIVHIAGQDLKITFIPPRNTHEILHRQPDITKQLEKLKYQPTFELDEGLKVTYESYKKSC